MPNSLLWVCLVAIWLFVLVPMVVKSRPAVRKTTDAAMSTRVLYRGGRAIAKTRRRMAAGRHPHDPDWEPPVREYRKTAKATAATATDDVESADTAPKTDSIKPEPAKVSVKKVAPAVATTPDAESEDDLNEVDVEVSAEVAEHDETLEDDLDDADLEDAEYDDSDDEDAEYDDVEYDDDIVDEAAGTDDVAEQAELDEIARRARRGGFDPEADRERSDKRYRFRQRVMAALSVLALVGVASGVLLGTAGWIVATITVVALVGYLAFLRRAVRNEQRIRHQRMQRLARAKRQEEERRAHPEVDPRAEVPRRLRRPGAIVLEIDDEDPIFDHLPRYEHREEVVREPSYRRVVGQ